MPIEVNSNESCIIQIFKIKVTTYVRPCTESFGELASDTHCPHTHMNTNT